MARHPYDLLPAYTKWSRGVARAGLQGFDPVTNFPFKINPDDKVATAGSCFAQHIARHLSKSGFTYFVTEAGHPLGDEALRAEYQYGVYSARYGNVYTARQLIQLWNRAFENLTPIGEPWQAADGSFIDPLRPTIQPGNFSSESEYERDRSQHLTAVRRMFKDLDYFVFTLGLTECWFDRRDGMALPICPGVAGGIYSDETTGFLNLTVQDVVADMTSFVRNLKIINPCAKIILTVSPVPLAATALNRHVAVSTTYSKSVLRVACEELTSIFSNVAYFPSFEIITNNTAGAGQYFAEDRRSVTEVGVEHVMRLFLKHATSNAPVENHTLIVDDTSITFQKMMSNVVKTQCDEEMLDKATLVAGH